MLPLFFSYTFSIQMGFHTNLSCQRLALALDYCIPTLEMTRLENFLPGWYWGRTWENTSHWTLLWSLLLSPYLITFLFPPTTPHSGSLSSLTLKGFFIGFHNRIWDSLMFLLTFVTFPKRIQAVIVGLSPSTEPEISLHLSDYLLFYSIGLTLWSCWYFKKPF